MRPIKVAYFDSHPLILSGFLAEFSQFEDIIVLHAGCSMAEYKDKVIPLKPDVIILETGILAGKVESIRSILVECPATKVVVFTGQSGVEHAVRALEAGASGFVSKTSRAAELADAIRSVMGGDTYITQSFASGVINALRDASLRKKAAAAIKLSIREEQIVKHLLRGRTNREISQKLEISEKTVKHYMSLLMQKLNARNRIEVVLAAQKLAGGQMAEAYPN